MTSPIDVVNRALSTIGTQSQIASFDEQSNEAITAKLWYDRLRQRLIRTAPWGFARKQLLMTQVGDLVPDQTSPFPWLWKYLYPADCLKIRYVLGLPIFPGTSIAPDVSSLPPFWTFKPSRTNRFVVSSDTDTHGNERRVVLTNVFNAYAVYNADITVCDNWDALFEDALEALLASKMVIALSGNVGMAQGLVALAEKAITAARAADGNESIPTADHTPDWIAARGSLGWGEGWANGDFGGGGLGVGCDTWGDWTSGWDSGGWAS